MPIHFSRHAYDQLKNRARISRSMVMDTVNKPENIKRSYRGRLLYQKTFGAETLEVVAVQEDNRLVIITEYFLEQS